MKKLLWVVSVPVLALALLECASEAYKVSNSLVEGSPDDPLSLVVLSYQDVKAKYGPTFMVNPFIAPESSVMPTYNDYIVLDLNFNLPATAPVILLRAEVSDERGKIFASYMTREKFTEFAMQQSPDQANNALKRNKIGWYYLPNPTMTIDAGKHTYVLVLVGRHPIPDTATIHVAVSVDDKATSFDIPVPISND